MLLQRIMTRDTDGDGNGDGGMVAKAIVIQDDYQGQLYLEAYVGFYDTEYLEALQECQP